MRSVLIAHALLEHWSSVSRSADVPSRGGSPRPLRVDSVYRVAAYSTSSPSHCTNGGGGRGANFLENQGKLKYLAGNRERRGVGAHYRSPPQYHFIFASQRNEFSRKISKITSFGGMPSILISAVQQIKLNLNSFLGSSEKIDPRW